MKRQDWEKRLKHDRDDRDALVACGNPKPKKPDPEGGLITVKCWNFSPATYWAHMQPLGHTAAQYEDCACSKPSGP